VTGKDEELNSKRKEKINEVDWVEGVNEDPMGVLS